MTTCILSSSADTGEERTDAYHAAAGGGGGVIAGCGEGGGGEELPHRAVCPPAPVPRSHGQGQRDTAQHTGGYIY